MKEGSNIQTIREVAYYYGKYAVARSVPVSKARSGLLYRRRAKQAVSRPSAEPKSKKVYTVSPATKRALKGRVAALLHYCLSRRIRLWFDTLTFSSNWQLTAEQTHAVLQSLALRYKTSKTASENLWLWVTERQENGTIHYHLLHTDSYNVRERQAALRRTLARVAPHIPSAEIERWNGLEHGGRAYRGGPKGPIECRRASAVGVYVTKMVSAVSGYLTKADGGEYTKRIWACSHAVGQLPVGEAVNVADDGYALPYDLTRMFHANEWCALFDFDQQATYGRTYLDRLAELLDREAEAQAVKVEVAAHDPPAPSFAQMRMIF